MYGPAIFPGAKHHHSVLVAFQDACRKTLFHERIIAPDRNKILCSDFPILI